jgi:hypothetical protein
MYTTTRRRAARLKIPSDDTGPNVRTGVGGVVGVGEGVRQQGARSDATDPAGGSGEGWGPGSGASVGTESRAAQPGHFHVRVDTM